MAAGNLLPLLRARRVDDGCGARHGCGGAGGEEIRKASVEKPGLVRPLIDATYEYRHALADGAELKEFCDDGGKRTLLWFHTQSRMLTASEPDEREHAEGLSVPVITYSGLDASEYAREQVCPSCGEAESIRYIGSRVAPSRPKTRNWPPATRYRS